MTATPTGHLCGTSQLAWSRTFNAPIGHVWDAVAVPELLDRWYGTFTGDPATGEVRLFMTAEGDREGSPVRVERCDKPSGYAVRTLGEGPTWVLAVDLSEIEGFTTLTLVQTFDSADGVDTIGPGWEYYLDRLVAVENGLDPATINFDGYHPSQGGYYARLADQMTF